jgi:hypothetical protein
LNKAFNKAFHRIAYAPGELGDGVDASRRAIGAVDCHPLSVPALTRQAIKRLQRSVLPASTLAGPPRYAFENCVR